MLELDFEKKVISCCLDFHAAMASTKPYIGCKIGLISRAQNRYEGILYTLDKINSTVVLANGEWCDLGCCQKKC